MRRRTPSPRRGEGWGEGVPMVRPEPPHPGPLPCGEREKNAPRKTLWLAAARPVDGLARRVALAKTLVFGFLERRQRPFRRRHVGAFGGARGDHRPSGFYGLAEGGSWQGGVAG